MFRVSRWAAGLTVVGVAVAAASAPAQTQTQRFAPTSTPRTQAPATAAPRTTAPAPAQTKAEPKPLDAAAIALQKKQTEDLLILWEKQSARLTTLDVGFDRIDRSVAWGDEVYKGRAYFQSPNLACIHTQKVDGKAVSDQERIVCTGKDVYQYNYETRQIFIFPLDKDQRKKALEEGPLPFLFNMKADEVKQRYQMQLLNQDANAYLIGVLPLLKEDRQVFSQAYLQLSKKTFLPDRLLLVSPNGKDTQDYRFNGVAANQRVEPAMFVGMRLQSWKVIDNPNPQQMQKAIDDARAARPGAQPKQQPAAARDMRPAPRR